MKKLGILIFIFLIFPSVFAVCGENQINVNSASLNELDKLTGIGEVKAQAIIDARPFDSVDDLIQTYGIGEVTLEKIKSQGLACVETEDDEPSEVESEEENIESDVITGNEVDMQGNIEKGVIALEPKDIKEDENSESNTKYVYGFVLFCIMLGLLFLLKFLKQKQERKYEE